MCVSALKGGNFHVGVDRKTLQATFSRNICNIWSGETAVCHTNPVLLPWPSLHEQSWRFFFFSSGILSLDPFCCLSAALEQQDRSSTEPKGA